MFYALIQKMKFLMKRNASQQVARTGQKFFAKKLRTHGQSTLEQNNSEWQSVFRSVDATSNIHYITEMSFYIGNAFIFSLHYFFFLHAYEVLIKKSTYIFNIKNTYLVHGASNEHLRCSWQMKISHFRKEQQNYKSQYKSCKYE